MYQKGEYIIYGNTGVCRVEDVAVPDNIPIKEKGALYYKLSPVYGVGSIYIPVDTEVFMRPVLTKAQANELIDKIPNIKEQVYEAKDQKNLADCYRASLRAHECEELVGMLCPAGLCTLIGVAFLGFDIRKAYQKHKKLEGEGRRLGKADAEYMKQAQALLHGELAVVLGISFEEVPKYIAARIE